MNLLLSNCNYVNPIYNYYGEAEEPITKCQVYLFNIYPYPKTGSVRDAQLFSYFMRENETLELIQF